jgi:hypothetical protein
MGAKEARMAPGADEFWGYSAAEWSAIGAMLTAIVTLILVLVGGWQIASIKRQNRRWRTLEACNCYHLDPSLRESLRKLREARDGGTLAGNERAFRVEIVTVLNYLDSIAIGIYQGLYLEGLARDHIQPMVNAHVRQYLRDGVPDRVGISEQDYRYL